MKIKIKIIVISLICVFCIGIIASIPYKNYKNAPKVAENTIAVYLSKKTKHPTFLNFKKVYHTIEVKNGTYVIELSGSADTASSSKDVSFVAKVIIHPFSGKATINKITFDDRKIIK